MPTSPSLCYKRLSQESSRQLLFSSGLFFNRLLQKIICTYVQTGFHIYNDQSLKRKFLFNLSIIIHFYHSSVKTIKEVVAIQKQATAGTNNTPNAGGDARAAASAVGPARPSNVPQQMVTSHYLCSYCDKPFRTKQNYDEHTNSMEHKIRIKSDTERSWKYRSPPLNVTNGQYKLCQRYTKKLK